MLYPRQQASPPPHLRQITSKEHFEDVVARAAGADETLSEGYEDANGAWRTPHKLLMVEIHAGWCRVCKGLQPKLLKLVKKHPEVLCCKINKTKNEVKQQRVHTCILYLEIVLVPGVKYGYTCVRATVPHSSSAILYCVLQSRLQTRATGLC